MHSIASTCVMGLACLMAVVSAAPLTTRDTGFSFPLPNGFPAITNPSPQLTAIEVAAQGTLPNGGPPSSLAHDDLVSLKFLAFGEIFEVAFFTDLKNNVTNNVPGYEFSDKVERELILNVLTTIMAQEELHTLNANVALKHFGIQPIQPCQYTFPVSDFKSAVALASTFTDVVLGTLQDIEAKLAMNGDFGLVRPVASVIGQEGEQNGFYRSLLGKVPSALPFLTTATREFAFSSLVQTFVVPGSCPNISTIPLPVFAPLTLVTAPIAPETQILEFSFVAKEYTPLVKPSSLSLVYINQQNLPIVEPLQSLVQQGNMVTFSANFPYDKFVMNGLTLANVVYGAGPFTSASAVANSTVYGPALIEIN